jgi:predicted permease
MAFAFIDDTRYALRQLRRNPWFAATVILTLALGIGVNSAMFTVIDAVLLRPLPFHDPDRIVVLAERGKQDRLNNASLPDIRDWQQAKSIEDLAYWAMKFHSAEANGVTDFLPQYITSPSLFSTLGAKPLIGRTYTAEDHDSLVLSYRAWHQFFHGDRNALGSFVRLGEKAYTVIGVMPPAFNFPNTGDGAVAWSPIPFDKQYEDRGLSLFEVIARLKPDVSVEQAHAELSGIQAQLARAYPDKDLADAVSVVNYIQQITGSFRSGLLALQAAVLTIWLIACANVASLLLTRTSVRQREFAIRTAIGASKWRLLRQGLSESCVLAFAGSAAGFVLGDLFLRLLRTFIDHYLPFSHRVHTDARVLVALVTFSALSALIFGSLPALQIALALPSEGLRTQSVATGVSRRQRRILDGIVAAEIALSLALLVSAGLLLRSLYALRHVPLGFSPDHVVQATLFLPQDKYRGKDVARILDQPVIERLQQLPGVEAVGLSTALPLQPNFTAIGTLEIDGRPKDPAHPISTSVHAVSPGYYRTLNIPLLKGRTFSESDGPASAYVAVVNRAFAEQYFARQNPVGNRFKMDDKGPHMYATIVGVVGDVHQRTAAESSQPEVNICYAQLTEKDGMTPFILGFFSQIAVRTKADPNSVLTSMRKVFRDIDSNLSVQDIQTMEASVDASFGKETLVARLLWIFAGSAMLICLTGIYGSLAYRVSWQTRDIGLRMTFGATRQQVLTMVLRQAAVVVVVGLAIGFAVSWLSGRVLQSFLFGVGAHDMSTLSGVSLMFVVCALIASYLPARRAAKLEPMRTLREE